VIRALCVVLALVTVVAAQERTDLVTRQGKPVTLVGRQPAVGDAAPTFTAVANDLSTYTFDPTSGKVWIVSVVPSIDTPVCSLQTKHFNDTAGALGGDVAILTVSMDLPFAQKRWCGAEGVNNLTTVSDFRDRSFAEQWGLRIKESGLLARAVYVVGRDGRITYAQLVPELTQEPQYEPVLAAAKAAAAK
jgi:thiol peroxidase